MKRTLNDWLDWFVRTEVTILGQFRPVMPLAGGSGCLLGSVGATLIGVRHGLCPWVILFLTLGALLTFLSLAMLTKILSGQEKLIYYHNKIAVIFTSTAILWFFGEPVLPYLDLVVLALGTFLVFGRIGCFMVGCCQGRPHSCGVCYGQEHVIEGFPPYLMGVRLLPIQLIESLWALIIVTVGSGIVLSKSSAGEVLTWDTIAYGIGRFCFELLRGDPDRPYWAGFSEAQWTSVVLITLGVAAEAADILPFHPWHMAAAGTLALAMIIIRVKRRYLDRVNYRLISARHVEEIADALELVSRLRDETVAAPRLTVPVATTSLGIQISAGRFEISPKLDVEHKLEPAKSDPPPSSWVYCYVLSVLDGSMAEETAGVLAKLILQLKHPAASNQLVQGLRKGIYHLLVSGPNDTELRAERP